MSKGCVIDAAYTRPAARARVETASPFAQALDASILETNDRSDLAMDMKVSLPDELAAFVEAKVSTGDYASSNDVVSDALRLMAEIDQRDSVRLHESWAAGKASGMFGEVDFEELRAEGRQRVANRRPTSDLGR